MQLTCLYVPDATTRLLPPQQLSASNTVSNANGSWLGFGKEALVFYEGRCIKFPYREGSNLPVAKLAPGISKFKAFHAVCSSVTSPSTPEPHRTDNLSQASRKLLRIHHRLGHKGFTELQKWAAAGSHNMPPEIATCPVPVCRACQYGAAKKRPHEKQNTGSVAGSPKAPGDFVSVDQMVAGSPGLIPFTSGQPSKRRYDTVTLWVDHFSKFLYAHCQEDATVKSTLESKVGFESFAQRYNVSLKHIHSDNGVFALKVFKDHVEASDQHQSFSGVGAHWQNGVIERFIGVITTRARTMLLHAMDLWPDVVTADFWSFAFMHAVRIHNCTPRTGQSKTPFTLFTNEDSPLSPNDFKVFGSPVYVLDRALSVALPLSS
jgi:transposase InsO family protein